MMDKEVEKLLYRQIENFSQSNQKIISNIIAEAMEPLIFLKKNDELEQTYHQYMDKIWNDSLNATNLYEDYNQKIEQFFEMREYDEDSYESYDDENFFEYLSYMATLVLGNALYKNSGALWYCSFSSFIEVSKILDDYFYYKNKDKVKINGLKDILESISQRIMENSCESLLRESITICFDSNNLDKKEMLKNNLKGYIDNLNMILKR